MQASNIVVVGGGQAGCQIIDSLLRAGYQGQIHLVGDEPQMPYQRPPLSKSFLNDEIAVERLWLKPKDFYQTVQIHLNTAITHIDRHHQQLTFNNGNKLPYEKLALCLGTRPRLLPVPGAEADGVHYLRTINDVECIKLALSDAKHIAIIGAGFIGLETAAMLKKMGKQVTVIEMQDRILPRVVAPEVAAFFQQYHQNHGIKFKLNTQVNGIANLDNRCAGVQTDTGDIDCDLCIVGIGVIPNFEIAETAGITCENGIVVDEFAQTNDPLIVAAGDCANHPNIFYQKNIRLESVHNAIEQAKTAAASLLGEALAYQQHPWFWSDQFDLKLQMVGLSQGYDQLVFRGDPAAKRFSVFYFCEDRLIAVDSINQPLEHMLSRKLLAKAVAITPAQASDNQFDLKAAVQ